MEFCCLDSSTNVLLMNQNNESIFIKERAYNVLVPDMWHFLILVIIIISNNNKKFGNSYKIKKQASCPLILQ